MKKLNIIKAVEVGDAEFEITLSTGQTVNVSAMEDIAPGKAQFALDGGKSSRSMSLQRTLELVQTAELILLNADDLTELLNALSPDELQLMS
jgi:hypothetical protein